MEHSDIHTRRFKKFVKSLLSGCLVRYRVSSKRPLVALTFDDGPREGVTDKVLETLSARGHTGTFFVLGRAAEKLPGLLKQIVNADCELGNHSFSHRLLHVTPYDQVISEIERTDEILSSFTSGPVWYRPPRGGLTLRVCLYLWCRAKKRQPILWSVAIPKEHLKTAPVALRIVDELRVTAGDIILLHDDHPGVISILEGLLDMLEAKGLRGVALTELIEPEAVRRNGEPNKNAN